MMRIDYSHSCRSQRSTRKPYLVDTHLFRSMNTIPMFSTALYWKLRQGTLQFVQIIAQGQVFFAKLFQFAREFAQLVIFHTCSRLQWIIFAHGESVGTVEHVLVLDIFSVFRNHIRCVLVGESREFYRAFVAISREYTIDHLLFLTA